jgi:predicted ester cyclase
MQRAARTFAKMPRCRAHFGDASMSQSFYPSPASSPTMRSSRSNDGVPMSPVFTSSIALAMAITPTIAAAQSMSDASLTERNKAVVRAYLGEIAQHGNIVSREWYFTSTTTFNGDRGLTRQFARVEEMRRAFPDLEMTIEQQIAEGPWVATRVTYRGTHAGEFGGIPATGRRIEFAGTAMDRLEGGKVVEMWHTVNMHLLMRQIEGNASPPQKP